MRGWLRYFALKAQVRTGLSAAVLTCAIIAAVAAAGAAVFLLVALFVWLAELYDGLMAGVVIGFGLGVFFSVDWAFIQDIIPADQGGLYMGFSNIATAGAGIIAALAVLAAGVSKEWSGRAQASGDDDGTPSED